MEHILIQDICFFSIVQSYDGKAGLLLTYLPKKKKRFDSGSFLLLHILIINNKPILTLQFDNTGFEVSSPGIQNQFNFYLRIICSVETLLFCKLE